MAGGSCPNSAPGMNSDVLNVLGCLAELHVLEKDKFVLRIGEVGSKDFLQGGHCGQQTPMDTRRIGFSGPSFIKGRI